MNRPGAGFVAGTWKRARAAAAGHQTAVYSYTRGFDIGRVRPIEGIIECAHQGLTQQPHPSVIVLYCCGNQKAGST